IANGVLAKASEQQQIEALMSAEIVDSTKKRLAAQEKFLEFEKKQTTAVKELTEVQARPIRQAEEMIAALEKEGVFLDKDTERTIRANAATLQLAENKERLIEAF